MFLYLHETTLLAGYQVKNKTRKFDWEEKKKKKKKHKKKPTINNWYPVLTFTN